MQRTEDDVRNFAERYDEENDSPFIEPDENLIVPHAAEFVDDMQMAIDFDASLDADGYANGASRRKPTAQERIEKRFFESCLSSASNTDLVEYQNEVYHEKWGGYDGGVEASLQGEWVDADFTDLCRRLDDCKQAADDGLKESAFLEMGGFVWLVSPTGASSGFWKYKYVLESHGLKLYIHSNPKGTIPPVRVRFGFECLARTDLFDAVETLRGMLASVGFTWVSETLSRVDMQILTDVDIYDFLNAMRGGRVVTQCRGKCEQVSDCHTMRVQTVTFRSENMELCIYDKKAAVLEGDRVYYMTFFRFVLQGAEMPEFLTRVEFRFRRGMLRRYGITSFSDLKKSQRALVQVAGRDWFRILEREKVRGSENEIANAPVWDRVMKAFEFYFGRENTSQRTPESLKEFKPEKGLPCMERTLKQAVGCLASVAAVCKEKVSDGLEIVKFCGNLLEDYAEQLYTKVSEKQIRNEITRAYTPDGKPAYDCISEVQQGLAPIGFTDFLDLGGERNKFA